MNKYERIVEIFNKCPSSEIFYVLLDWIDDKRGDIPGDLMKEIEEKYEEYK